MSEIAITAGVPVARLSAAIDATTLTIPLETGQGATMPAVPFPIQIDLENMLITAVATDTLTAAARGYGDTIAAAHADDAAVWHVTTPESWPTRLDDTTGDYTAQGEILAAGLLKYRGLWAAGTYEKDDVVTSGGWLMRANKQTDDPAEPVAGAPPQWLLPDAPEWTAVSESDEVNTGIRVQNPGLYSFISGVRAFLPSLNSRISYQLIQIDNDTGEWIIYSPFTGDDLQAIGWRSLGNPGIIGTDSDISWLLRTWDNSATTDTLLGYTWLGYSNVENDPGSGNCEARRDGTLVRFNDVDDSAVNQDTFFGTVEPGTVLTITQDDDATKFLAYTIAADAEELGYWRFGTSKLGEGAGGPPDDDASCTAEFRIPDNTGAVPYVKLTNYWLANAAIDGQLSLGTATPVDTDDAYGIDLLVQEFTFSPDWDPLAFSGGSAGGGGGAAPVVARVKRVAVWNVPTSAVVTPIPWDTETFDTADIWEGVTNPTRLTAPVDGLYRITACVGMDTATNADLVGGYHINGASVQNSLEAFGRIGDTDSGTANEVAGSDLVQLAAGDYIEVVTYVASATRTLRLATFACLELVT